jgi:hypothetical protein
VDQSWFTIRNFSDELMRLRDKRLSLTQVTRQFIHLVAYKLQ